MKLQLDHSVLRLLHRKQKQTEFNDPVNKCYRRKYIPTFSLKKEDEIFIKKRESLNV